MPEHQTPNPNLDAFGLPPTGHERREELKRRTDNLEEQGERVYSDAGTIPSDVLKPDREIRDHIVKDHLAIGADHPYYKTKWVNWKNLEGQKVWEAKADGWRVATAKEFPDAEGLVKEDNTIRVGDTMLMFMRFDEHMKLEERERNKRLRQQYGIEAEIHDLAEKVNIATGRKVFGSISTPEFTGVPEHLMKTMEARAKRSDFARKVAAQHLGNRMKQGMIDGLPIK